MGGIERADQWGGLEGLDRGAVTVPPQLPAVGLRRAAKAMPAARLLELPKCGHLPLIELPNELLRFMEDVLAEPAGAAVVT